MKKQGYSSRLDESLAMRKGKKKKQPIKERRRESEAMEKAEHMSPYASVKSMHKKMMPKGKKKAK